MAVRVALHGPVNNVAYGMAAGLASAGSDVAFVHARDSSVPIDQPVWQDADFALSREEFAQSGQWDAEGWTRFERQLGWTPPRWVVPADPEGAGRYVAAPGTPPLLRGALTALGRRNPSWPAVQRAWSQADLLVVSGMRPTMQAAGSGRPFVVWPHGSDARNAAHDFDRFIQGRRQRAVAEATSLLLRRSYRQARAIVTHDPMLTTGSTQGCAVLERLAPVRFLAWPVEPSPRPAPAQRRERLGVLLDRLEAAPVTAERVALVASRIEYRHKGHDRLIDALARLGDHGTHYLFVGWGPDLPQAQAALDAAGLGRRVSLLPKIMSKQLVRELFASVDLSLDQFVWGTYGLSAIESMAAGTPVVMAVDEAAFARRGWEPPPALAASSSDQLHALLASVAEGRVDLDQAADRGLAWIGRRHAPAAVRQQLEQLVAELGLDPTEAAT